MKKFTTLCLVLLALNVFSQNPYGSILVGERIILDYRGNIKGKDFVYNEWNRGMIVLNDSVFSKQDYLKYDAFNDRVLIKNQKDIDEVIEITDKTLTGFSILEIDRNFKHDFVKLNALKFKNNGESGFYEIVFNLSNTNYFLKKNKKIVFDPNRSKGSQTINNLPLEFKDKNSYFIKNNEGLYVKVRLKKKDIKSVLVNHSNLIDSYIKSKKLKYYKESDVMKLVSYYYSL